MNRKQRRTKETKALDAARKAKQEEAQEKRRPKKTKGNEQPAAAEGEEEAWETASDDDDDNPNNVDERFADMEEDVPDDVDGEEEEEDEDYEAFTESMKKVRFQEPERLEREGGEDNDDDDDDDGVRRGPKQLPKVWRPDLGDMLPEGEELTYSNKAYDSFFQLRSEFPCLSFDILKDGEGASRTRYPLTMYFVCGSQADEQNKNQLYILKISNICRTKHDKESDEDSDSSEDDEEEEEEEDTGAGEDVNNGEPLVEHRLIKHHATANRVRTSHHNTSLVAVWSETGYIQVFDTDDDYRALADFANWSKEKAKAWANPTKAIPLKFCSSSSTHKTEGYGLDWSTLQNNTFASGDCSGTIFVWKPASGGRWAPSGSYSAAGAQSVEEIRWSPTQSDVLIACRAGGTVEVWDTRDMRSSRLCWQADPTDINVADWNTAKQSSHLFVTGSESGVVAVWDLRKVQGGNSATPLQTVTWHSGHAISSIEFSAHNENVMAVTADDGQCTLWDLSVEPDVDAAPTVGDDNDAQVPDQLMFQHQGLLHPKEVHWHSQIPGLVVTTDYNGLNIFKPVNWRSLMQ